MIALFLPLEYCNFTYYETITKVACFDGPSLGLINNLAPLRFNSFCVGITAPIQCFPSEINGNMVYYNGVHGI